MSGERTVAIGTLSVFDCSHNRSCHGDFHICNKTIFLSARLAQLVARPAQHLEVRRFDFRVRHILLLV